MDLLPGQVVKTHDFPGQPRSSVSEVRAVFIFGSLYESALSVYANMERNGPDWIAAHFRHMRANGKFEDLLTHDVLRQAEQIEAWMRWSEFPVMCVRYEALWDHAKDISDFTGLPCRFPERRARSEKDIPQDLCALARETYSALDEKFSALPDCFSAPLTVGSN